MLVDCAFFVNCGQDISERVAVLRAQRARRQRLPRTVAVGAGGGDAAVAEDVAGCGGGGDGGAGGGGRCGGGAGGDWLVVVTRRLYRVRFVTRVWPNELQAILCAQFRYGFFQ